MVDFVDKYQEEHQAAEDFRRQLQERWMEASQPSAAERLRWLNDNTALLEEIARVSWGSASGVGLTPAQFKEELAAVPLPSPHDDPLTHSIVHMLSQQIEVACGELKIPLHSGVAYGSNAGL